MMSLVERVAQLNDCACAASNANLLYRYQAGNFQIDYRSTVRHADDKSSRVSDFLRCREASRIRTSRGVT